MEPRRNRRGPAPARADRRRRGAPLRSRPSRRFRPRAGALLALAAVAGLILGWRVTHGHKGHTPPPVAAAAASSSSTAGGDVHGPSWQTLPMLGAGGAPTVTAAVADPDGSLWLVAVADGGTPYLVHVSTSGEQGAWAVPPPKGAALRIQTIGTDKVWLAAGPLELSFDKTSAAFQTYTVQPALGATTVAGYSVALYVPQTSGGAVSGPPYVQVAPLGATGARRVPLPQAVTPAAIPPAAVLPGPAGQALVVVGALVWSVSPKDASAAVWGRLPADADPASAGWGADRLWVGTATGGIADLDSGGTPQLLAAGASHPPAQRTGLTFSGGRLWWAGAGAAYAYSPASNAVASYPYPVPGIGMLAPGAAGAVWAAVGDRFAVLGTSK